MLGGLAEHGRPLPRRRICAPVGKYRIYDTDAEVQNANWKVIVDNYLEGYHVPVAHPGLMRLLDYQRYTVDHRRALRLLRGAAAGQAVVEPAGALLPAARRRRCRVCADGDQRMWRYLAIYPNTLIDFYPDHVLAWKIMPHEVGTAALPGAFYARPGTSLRTRLAQRLNIKIGWITNDEDAELVARVQKGIATPGWGPGPLSRREAGVALVRRPHSRDVDPHLTDDTAREGAA